MATLTLEEQIVREIAAFERAVGDYYRALHAEALQALQHAVDHHDTSRVRWLLDHPAFEDIRDGLDAWFRTQASLYWTDAGNLRFVPYTDEGYRDFDPSSATDFSTFGAHLGLPATLHR
jgi:hypothetical protein